MARTLDDCTPAEWDAASAAARPHRAPPGDPVRTPNHYTTHPSGVECLELAGGMPFNIGSACKYVWRRNLKGTPAQDLAKALRYIEYELRDGAGPVRATTSAERVAMQRVSEAEPAAWVSLALYALQGAADGAQDSQTRSRCLVRAAVLIGREVERLQQETAQ